MLGGSPTWARVRRLSRDGLRFCSRDDLTHTVSQLLGPLHVALVSYRDSEPCDSDTWLQQVPAIDGTVPADPGTLGSECCASLRSEGAGASPAEREGAAGLRPAPGTTALSLWAALARSHARLPLRGCGASLLRLVRVHPPSHHSSSRVSPAPSLCSRGRMLWWSGATRTDEEAWPC